MKYSSEYMNKLLNLNAKIIIPYSGKGVFHVLMWEDLIHKADPGAVVFATHLSAFKKLQKHSKLNIIHVPESMLGNLKDIIPGNIKLALYPHNSGINKYYIRYGKYLNIFIHHGDSEKSACFSKKSKRYDYLFVAGQAAIDRYHTNGILIPNEKFRIIGRPTTDSIIDSGDPKRHDNNVTILYAPTWINAKSSVRYSSLEFGDKIVKNLISNNIQVIFRPHPVSRNSKKFGGYVQNIDNILSEDMKHSSRKHIFGSEVDLSSFAECANISDAMICDISGVLTDYLASTKPVAVNRPSGNIKQANNASRLWKCVYFLDRNLINFSEVIHNMTKNDYMRIKREKIKDYYLGGLYKGKSSKKFIFEINKLLLR